MKLKFIKSFVIISLIGSFIIPSYATITSNDGSAFVTKSEFDSALTDFGTRLTTFEAGINSKIDSQVTSYLDRNGIWNGVEQKLGTTLSKNSLQAPALYTNIVYVDSVYKAEGDMVLQTPTVYIPKISKTGMLVGTWMWVCSSSTNNNDTRWGWNGNVYNSTTWRSQASFYLTIKFEEYANETSSTVLDTPYSAIILSGMGDTNGDGSTLYDFNFTSPVSTEQIVTPYQFFVNKGSCIKWSVVLYYRVFGLYGTSSTYLAPRTAANSKINIQVQSAKVY